MTGGMFDVCFEVRSAEHIILISYKLYEKS